MAWWAWLIIWTVLVLGLLATLAGLGYRLYRKFRGALDALGELTDQVARLSDVVEDLAPEPAERAITLGYAEVARRRDEHHRLRGELRQSRRDARLARGKLLVNPEIVPTLRK